MLKLKHILAAGVIGALALSLWHPRRAVALNNDPPALLVPERAFDLGVSEHSLPAAGRQLRLEDYLYRGAEELADAYADRHENAYWRQDRLRRFAAEIAAATVEQLSGDPNDWKYAGTLLWIAHRETRITRRPRLLGTEDGGRAAGPWQIWGGRYGSPFRARTALAMLLHEASGWSLPQHEPWVGYPECARWLAEHPFE